MRLVLALVLVPLLAMTASSCAWRKAKKKDYARPLPPGELALREIDIATVPFVHIADREAVHRALAVAE